MKCYKNQNFYYMFYIYFIYIKFYFDYIFGIYVICFIIYLLYYIYMHIICFLILLYISIFILFGFITFLFSLYVQNCYNVKFLLQKKKKILMVRIFCVIWIFLLYGFHKVFKAGKIWSSICIQDNVKPEVHYQIDLIG